MSHWFTKVRKNSKFFYAQRMENDQRILIFLHKVLSHRAGRYALSVGRFLIRWKIF